MVLDPSPPPLGAVSVHVPFSRKDAPPPLPPSLDGESKKKNPPKKVPPKKKMFVIIPGDTNSYEVLMRGWRTTICSLCIMTLRQQ